MDAFVHARTDDVALLCAEEKYNELSGKVWSSEEIEPAAFDPIAEQIGDAATEISFTPPRTLAGAAIKLRLILDHLVIEEAEDGEDVLSLRQVVAFLEERELVHVAVINA